MLSRAEKFNTPSVSEVGSSFSFFKRYELYGLDHRLLSEGDPSHLVTVCGSLV
jgi:hypothetical protein